jgi:hypothetical protein
MKRSPLVVVFCTLLLNAAVVSVVPGEPASVIQVLIDGARPGDVIDLPEGRFEGRIVLKDGISLVGAEGGKTVIDGTGAETVITGGNGSIISGLTVVGGKAGVDTCGCLMGIVDCSFKGEKNMAIHVAGGSAVVINNLVEGGSISCNSSCPIIVCNTVIPKGTDGIWSWYAPGPKAINNLIVGAKAGIRAGAGSVPILQHNALWKNEKDFDGCEADAGAVTTDPLLVKPEEGDYRLGDSSPLVSAGVAVEGLWNGENPDIGRNAGRRCDLEECKALMEAVAAELVRKGAVVIYTLGDEPGAVLVTVANSRRSFSIRSSTEQTAVSDIEAFDERGVEALEAELVEEAYPVVKVREASAAAPAGDLAVAGEKSAGIPDDNNDNRYVLKEMYHSAESYFDSGDLRIFRRKTNLPRVVVEIPDGYEIVYILNNGCQIDIPEKIEFASLGLKEIEIGMRKKST